MSPFSDISFIFHCIVHSRVRASYSAPPPRKSPGERQFSCATFLGQKRELFPPLAPRLLIAM